MDKLKPYQFLDDETRSVKGPTPIYWEGHGDIVVNDKEGYNHDKVAYIVHIQQIKQQKNTLPMGENMVKCIAKSTCQSTC